MFTPTFLRRVSQLVIITFTSLTLQPLQAAVMAERQQKAIAASQSAATPQAPAQQTKEEKYGELLENIKAAAKKDTSPQAAAKGSQAQNQALRDDARELRGYTRQLEAMETEVETDFIATEQHIKDHKLPAVILARQQAAVKDYKAKQTEFKNKLKALEDADDKNDDKRRATALNDMAVWLEKNQKSKTHPKTDPNKLPFGTSDGKVRPPKKTEREYRASLFKPAPIHLAGPIPNGFTLPATTLPVTPTAADLAATEDIVITPAIKALAASLNNNPVQIYNWVRNNIEYLPTYGSIQGADMTLQTKRGNSFDTASLLIATLRAAGIPARYVYGTIQIPADQAMNWVGGVTKPEAAQQIMGQGGIPNIGMAAGGLIKAIQLEHVWVEAYVDYTPSRGAINKKPDTWVQMDASFKQYTYTQGMDIKTAVPLDANALITQAQAGATVDPSGWVQNMNASAVQATLATYQTQVQNYIAATKANATVGDVIGTKTIIPQNHPILMGTLPYKTIAEGGKFSALPAMVRHQFQYNLYATAMDRAMGNAVFSYQQSLPNLAGKKITLSFAPATQADANLIASYLPAPNANGTPIQLNQLPTSLPGYLIHLNAELRVDGQAVAVGGPFTMGDELIASEGLFDPTRGWDYASDTAPIAGEYIATHVDLQGVSSAQLQAVKDRLTATQAKLQAQQLVGLTKEDLIGDTLQSGVLNYFAANYVVAQIAQRATGIIEYRKPSFGNFETSIKPLYWFGIPRNVIFSGFMMDINHYASMNVAKDNNPATVIAYNKRIGMSYSANEHLIPEQLFTDPAIPNQQQGASAAKAMALASYQGQRIYTLNAANQANHATLLAQVTIDPQARAEIQNALAVGKEVTVHQSPITQGGWKGSGYIITDPTTGAGAYMISGGFNGGVLQVVGDNSTAIGFAFFVLGLIGAAGALPVLAGTALAVGPLVLALILISGFVMSAIAIAAAELDAFDQAKCAQAIPCIERITTTIFAVSIALAVLGIFATPVVGILLGALGLIYGDDLIRAATRGCNMRCQ